MGPIRTFLKAVERLARNGDISIDDAYRFAKQQFGEVSDLMKLQINKLFKQKQASGTRKQEKNNVITFVPKDKLRPAQMEEEGLGIESLRNPFRPGGGLDPLEGMTRTAARVVLNRRGIKIPDRADAIDVFEENFGGDALMDLKNVAEELVEKETTGNITESMGKFLESEGMFDLKINKDAPKAMSNKELLEKMEETEAEDILKKFDPEDREPNSKGGINRTSYAFGTGIKLSPYLAKLGKNLKKEIKKAINNFIQPSGDRKLDADVILDDMFEELNLDKDMFDQKDILDAYDEIYTTISKPSASELRVRNEMKEKYGFTDEKLDEIKNTPIDEEMADRLIKETDLPEGVDPRDTILPMGEELAPKMKERFELKQKYPGLDDELLTAIIDDPDPNNKAQVLATLDQALELQKQGKTPEEAVDILKETMFKRKDNAEGGLNYLMGM